tara:strand:- start:94 stop:309 length:216 start_codon:yes stop_codon:yes gene_type:complete
MIRQTMDLPMQTKYKMQLGITHEEIIGLLGGQPLKFTFQNDEDLPDIKVEIKEVEDDSALFEQMQLSIDNE